VLAHEDGHYIVQDWMGAIVEISDQYDLTYLRQARDFVTRKWHRFPVQSRADWERMKERYDPHDAERQPRDLERAGELLDDRDYLLAFGFNGPFWQLREWCGFEGLCTLMRDDPDLVQEMCEFWAEFVSIVIAPRLRSATCGLDAVTISEDMAFKEHSMISPAMTRRFLLPAYRRWVPQLKASGCRIVDMDSDGYVADLIPIWIEAGITACWPIEVAAGNDIVAYRRVFGRRMAYHGGLDKRALARGGEAMRAELLRVIPPLLEEGGFIPGCDHGVPPDISWPDFVAYGRLLAELTGWL
jgi:uroporphyrinogen decarboxylase